MYQVVGNDAQIYGPVNIETLKTWVAEGKLARHTIVIDPISGHSGPAEMMLRDWDLFAAQSPPPLRNPTGNSNGNSTPYPTSPYPAPSTRLEADLGERFLGYLIDLAIGLPLGLLANVPFLGLIVAPLFCGYWLSRDAFFQGRSIGKRVVKIRVIRQDGTPIGWGQSALRNLMYSWGLLLVIPVIGETADGVLVACGVLDFVLVLASRRRAGDYLAGTRIVKDTV